VATVARPMTDPDSPADSVPTTGPDADAGDSDGSERGAGGGESAADTHRRAESRLANASRADEEEDQSVNDSGALREPEPIEPESPRAENALFVLLGVLGTVALLATAIPGVP